MNEYGQNNDYVYEQPLDSYDLYVAGKTKEAKKTVSRLILSLFVLSIVAYAVIFAVEIVYLFVNPKGFDTFFSNIYVQWIMQVVSMYIFGLGAFLLISLGIKPTKRAKSTLPISELLIYILIAEGLMFIGNIIGTGLSDAIGALRGGELDNAVSDMIMATPLWLIILGSVVVGPIIEELIFRKVLLDRLARYGDWFAILITAVAFGLFHGNFYQFFYAALLGVLLGFVAVKTGNWIYSVIIHIAVNFLGSVPAVLITKVADEVLDASEAMVNGESIDVIEFWQNSMIISSYTIIQYALFITGVVLLIVKLKNRSFKVDNAVCEFRIPSHKVCNTIFANVGTILFLVFSGLIFISNIIFV